MHCLYKITPNRIASFSSIKTFLSLMFSGISDTNECEDKVHNCSDTANCVDVIGTYRCECLPGYHGDGHNCLSRCLAEVLSKSLPNKNIKILPLWLH